MRYLQFILNEILIYISMKFLFWIVIYTQFHVKSFPLVIKLKNIVVRSLSLDILFMSRRKLQLVVINRAWPSHYILLFNDRIFLLHFVRTKLRKSVHKWTHYECFTVLI